LDVAISRAFGFVVQGQRGGVRRVPGEPDADAWDEADREARDALDAFEEAVQAELGVVQLKSKD
jgi:hypothetical protein